MDIDSTHHRKSIRLKSYDYAQAGMYYLTICTHQRKRYLGSIVDGRVSLGGGTKRCMTPFFSQ